MLWAYDEAVVKDISNCINPTGGANSTVKMMGEDGIMGVLAQMNDDRIKFPAIFIERSSDTPLDSSRYHFSKLHRGIPVGFDPETNDIYLERSIPIKLKYNLHVLTTNTADMDELIKELIFRYSEMYYISMEIPYESKRIIRFGMSINPDASITKKSGVANYFENGQLYESIVEIDCQGAVMISYTPKHIERLVMGKIVDKATSQP